MNLLEKINARQFSVAVVGLGYVGLPLAVEFAKQGIKTYGIDVDPRKIDSLREVLAFAFEASLLVGQSQETAISKKLASWAAILAVPTAFAGIYGMNFSDMPELHMEYGYPVVLGIIASICGVLYWRFRKNGWL